jgi:hypothetical protein
MTVAVRNNNSVNMSYTTTCATTGSIVACGFDRAVAPVAAGGVGGVRVAYVAGASSGPGTVTVQLNGGGADQVTATVAVMVVEAKR